MLNFQGVFGMPLADICRSLGLHNKGEADPPKLSANWVEGHPFFWSNSSDRKHEFSPQMVVEFLGNRTFISGTSRVGEIWFHSARFFTSDSMFLFSKKSCTKTPFRGIQSKSCQVMDIYKLTQNRKTSSSCIKRKGGKHLPEHPLHLFGGELLP